MAELGIRRERVNDLVGWDLDRRKVVVAVGDGVGNVVKHLGVEVAVVRKRLDDLRMLCRVFSSDNVQ